MDATLTEVVQLDRWNLPVGTSRGNEATEARKRFRK